MVVTAKHLLQSLRSAYITSFVTITLFCGFTRKNRRLPPSFLDLFVMTTYDLTVTQSNVTESM